MDLQKKIILDRLIPLSREYGYEYKQIDGMPYFRQIHSEYVLNSSIYWFRHRQHAFGYTLSITAVEDIIMDIGTPVNDFSSHRKRELYLDTLGDLHGLSLRRTIEVQTEYDAIAFADYVSGLLTGRMLEFSDYYSHLPNVLAEMNRLEAEGKYWKEIIGSNGPEWFWRGLIISKLCNDIDFEKKLKWVDSIYYDAQYSLDEWLPYYEKLKVRLQDLQPMYNV
jgi:hypothetical protein